MLGNRCPRLIVAYLNLSIRIRYICTISSCSITLASSTQNMNGELGNGINIDGIQTPVIAWRCRSRYISAYPISVPTPSAPNCHIFSASLPHSPFQDPQNPKDQTEKPSRAPA